MLCFWNISAFEEAHLHMRYTQIIGTTDFVSLAENKYTKYQGPSSKDFEIPCYLNVEK